jgi:HAD superfamily hydrolase (TIGR01509 family)
MTDFQAILFDNDGLLVDTEKFYVQSNQEVVQEMFDLEYDLSDYQHYGYVMGIGTGGFLRDRFISEDMIEEFRVERDRRYESFLAQPVEILPGAAEILKTLSSKFDLACVTAAPRKHFELIHAQTGFEKFFKFSVTNEDVSRTKPSPEGYLLAAQKLGVDPEKCLVLEDSPRGMVAGKSAGMTVFGIPTAQTKHLDLSMADRVFGSLWEVMEVL